MDNMKLPNGWKYIKISDLTSVITGGTPSTTKSEYWAGGDIPWLPSGECKDGEINSATKFITEEGMKNSAAKLMPLNTVIIALTGATTGKVGILNIEATANQSVTGIVPSDKFIPKYIFFYLQSIRTKILNDSYGGAQKHISQGYVKDIELLLPPLETQKKIVKVLEKAENALEKRKESIKLLDELVKSKFVEMFGDPVLNTKNWEVKIVIDVCDCMVPGRDKPKTFTGSTPWITIDDLNVNGVTYKSKSNLGLTDDEINEVKRKKVPKGSVIMSCVGDLGICSIAGEEIIINQQLHSFQCQDISNFFLMYYLGFRKDYMMSQASSTTVLYMNKTVCNSIPIYLPTIELQNQFADFVKQVDKLKFEMKKSLKELENNFNSLMQSAFKGELFN